MISVGILSSLPEEASKVQFDIAKLCELWWTRELDGKDDLATQTMLYFLNKSLSPNATVSIKFLVFHQNMQINHKIIILKKVFNKKNTRNKQSYDLICVNEKNGRKNGIDTLIREFEKEKEICQTKKVFLYSFFPV